MSILNTLLLREKGLLKNNFYQDATMTAALNRAHQPVLEIGELNNSTYFLKMKSDGKIILVETHEDLNTEWSYVYFLECMYNLSNVAQTNEYLPLVSTFKVKKHFSENFIIEDTADAKIKGCKPVLYAGNRNADFPGMLFLKFFNRKVFLWKLKKQVFCCTNCNYREQFAAGVHGGYFFFNLKTNKEYQVTEDDVISLQFNENGNWLFVGTRCKGVSIQDIREHSCYKKFRSLTNEVGYTCRNLHKIGTISTCAKEIKLLSDQISLIVSGHQGYTEKVDIRMMKTVFQYPGHIGHDYKRSLCINEDLDLISAAGKDRKIRIWTLGSGKLIYEKEIWGKGFLRDLPSHCCFLSNERRWLLCALLDDYVVPIVPTEF